jgi:peptidoglycan-N-acetylglucosamine deacetylase
MSARRLMRFIVALFVCTVAGLSVPASAECPGNPDALGTSRVLTMNPGEFTLLGTIQYKQTLPLKDHEVVITFDDGPLPPYTNIILDTLASQCAPLGAPVSAVGEAVPSVVGEAINSGTDFGRSPAATTCTTL